MGLVWGQGGRHRLLTERDVSAAHIAAPHVLAQWRSGDAREWRHLWFTLAIGTAFPLFGYFAFDWPPALVAIYLLFDIGVLAFCDGLMLRLDGARVMQERAHLDEALLIRAVIDGLRRPRKVPLAQRDVLAAPASPRYYLVEPPPRDGLVAEWFVVGIILLAVSLVSSLAWTYYTLRAATPSFAELALLILGAIVRLVVRGVEIRHLRNDPSPHPEVMSQAAMPAGALMIAWTLLAGLYEWFRDLGSPTRPDVVIALLLSLYVVAASGLALIGIANVRHLMREMKAFAAQDREQLRQRVRRVNEADWCE